jgi:hypothetical protein
MKRGREILALSAVRNHWFLIGCVVELSLLFARAMLVFLLGQPIFGNLKWCLRDLWLGILANLVVFPIPSEALQHDEEASRVRPIEVRPGDRPRNLQAVLANRGGERARFLADPLRRCLMTTSTIESAATFMP